MLITRATRVRWRLGVIGIFLTLLACPGLGVDRPHIVLITLDTTRADYLSVYGETVRGTPHLEALAREGAVFDAAYCDVTLTTPSMASTLTGTYPYRHGLRHMLNTLPDSATTVAESLKAVGYRTAAVVASPPLDARFGLDQGFDRYSYPRSGPSSFHTSVRSDDVVTSHALRFLASLVDQRRPFFLWVHYFGPHARVDPDREYLQNLGRHLVTYADKVVDTDAAVGGLLQGLAFHGLVGDTLVIVHADHGESLGEHDFIGHGRYLYDEILRVPLIMRWPGRVPMGLRIASLVANVDVAATILDAAGIEGGIADAMDGRSLLPLIDGKEGSRDSLYLETYQPSMPGFGDSLSSADGSVEHVQVRRVGVLRPPWKYVVTERFSFDEDPETIVRESSPDRIVRRDFYELTRDPDELRPLEEPSDEPEIADTLRRLLKTHVETAERLDAGTLQEDVPEHLRAMLESLGYLN
jgi:arylsulfatase A-like enzyme